MTAPDQAVVVTYRELAPSAALRNHVRAYYSFTPSAAPWRESRALLREVNFTRGESFCSPRFADGHASAVVDLGATCNLDGDWSYGTPVRAHAIGALRRVGAPAGSDRPKMIGVYFEPGAASGRYCMFPRSRSRIESSASTICGVHRVRAWPKTWRSWMSRRASTYSRQCCSNAYGVRHAADHRSMP